MSNTYKQGAGVPTSAPINFERLFVRGVEVTPGEQPAAEPVEAIIMEHIKRVNTTGEINVSLLAKSFNLMLDELEDKGYMKKK